MVNPINVGNILLENLKQEFGEVPDSPRSEDEDDLAKQLLCTIKSVVSDVTTDLIEVKYEHDEDEFEETHDDLDFNPFENDEADNEKDNIDEQDSDESDNDENKSGRFSRKSKKAKKKKDPDYVFEEEKPRKSTTFTTDYTKKVVEYYDKYGWKSLTHRFRRVKDRSQVMQFKKQLQNSGSQYAKYRIVSETVLKKYNEATAGGQKVVSKDLHRWAQETSNEQGFDFKISAQWVNRFKLANKISFRDVKSEEESAIVRKELLKKYCEAKATGQKVTDKGLQKWAQDFSDELGFEKKIALGWVYHFKEIYSISLKEKKSDTSTKSAQGTSGDYTTPAPTGRRKRKRKNVKNDISTDNNLKSVKSLKKNSKTKSKEISPSASTATANDTSTAEAQDPVHQIPGHFQTTVPAPISFPMYAQGQNSGQGIGELMSSYSSAGVPMPSQTISQDAWSQLLFPMDDPRSQYPMSQPQLGPPYPLNIPQSQSSQMMSSNFQASSQSAHNFPNFPHGSS